MLLFAPLSDALWFFLASARPSRSEQWLITTSTGAITENGHMKTSNHPYEGSGTLFQVSPMEGFPGLSGKASVPPGFNLRFTGPRP